VDYYGYPYSSEARLQECYRRVSYDILELSMTLTDPKTYTKPWDSETKKFRSIPKEKSGASGWAGLVQDICAPMDEVEQFNNRVRDPAGGVSPAK
jgi:hypothetical protein